MMPPGEAVTMVTDYLLALTAFIAASWLWRRAEGRAGRWWAAGFVASGVAAILGGTSHGYAPVLHPQAYGLLWRLTYVTVEVANQCVLYGAALAGLPPQMHRIALAILLLRLVIVAGMLIVFAQMRYVISDYAITFLGIAGLAATLAARRQPGAGWVIAGAAASAIGGAILLARIGQGRVFNHNDVFHLLQALGIALYARGGRELVVRER